MKMAICRRASMTVAALALFAPTAQADPSGPVTACTSDAQVGAGLNLAQALAAGGVVRFQCPAGSVIRITRKYVLRTSTLLDGGDTVVLDGHGLPGPMLSALQNVILRRLTIRGFSRKPLPQPSQGKTIGRQNGSVLNAFKDAELDHATIENSEFPIDVLGTATVVDSVFSGNRGGLSLNAQGVAHVERTRFSGNGREVFFSSGWLRNCNFNGQTAGAVTVDLPTGPVEIRQCRFSAVRGGSPLSLSQRAGSHGPQTITIQSNVFNGNDGGTAAGAITLFDPLRAARDRGESASVLTALAALPAASFVLGYNRFTGNRGGSGGAIQADLAHTQGMLSKGDLFVDNTATGDGGAIAVSGGPLRISHALFMRNHAGRRGAALAAKSDGSILLSNSLAVRNVGPAGTITGSSINLINVTIADNEAAGLLLETRAAQVANVLLARNRPSDCMGVPAGVFGGGGMQSDGSCPGIAVGEAFLDAFYVPAAGSPALRAGDAALCRGLVVGSVDLAFQVRPSRVSCALGAFESPPLKRLVSKTDRPQVHATTADDFPDDGAFHPAAPSSPTGYMPPGGITPSDGNGPPYKTPPPSTVTPSEGKSPTYKNTPPYTQPSSKAPTYTPPSSKLPVSDNSSSYPAASSSTPEEPAAHEGWWKKLWNGRRPAAVPANSAMNTVLAALQAEAAAPLERIHGFMTRSTTVDDYAIDRVGTRRSHLRIDPREGGPEVIVVDGMQWTRTGKSAPWHNSPVLETASTVPSAADLFTNGLTHAIEQQGPKGGRSVAGDLEWTNGGSCAGKVTLTVDGLGLPSALRFDGVCDGKLLRFHQAFSFQGPLAITPPA